MLQESKELNRIEQSIKKLDSNLQGTFWLAGRKS